MAFNPSWPWPNFSSAEIACKCGCGETFVHAESMDALQLLRELWGHPIRINSAHRCAAHNERVGGTANSQHLKIAFDCRCLREHQAAFVNLAKEVGFRGIGTYPSRNFVHLDMGVKREWRG
ncbi:MAG: hypothetical protein DELT_01714 [Desulfovibrio sp.]